MDDLKSKQETIVKSEWGNYVITQKFLDDVQQHNILHLNELPLSCPIRLIHGMKDDYVPYELSIKLAEKIASRDVSVLFRKTGDHRMSQPEDITMIFEELDLLVKGRRRDVRKLAIESWASFSVYSHPDRDLESKKK